MRREKELKYHTRNIYGSVKNKNNFKLMEDGKALFLKYQGCNELYVSQTTLISWVNNVNWRLMVFQQIYFIVLDWLIKIINLWMVMFALGSLIVLCLIRKEIFVAINI
jgi:hypothetical protein